MRPFRQSFAWASCLIALLPRAATAQSADDFNPGANGQVFAVAFEASGSMVVGGVFTTIGGGGTGATPRARLARLSTAGTVDPTFNPGASGIVRAVAVLTNGQMIVAGSFTGLGGGSGTTARSRVGLLNRDGTVDPTFNPGANGTVHAIAVQTDGRILVGGEFTMIGGGGTGSTARNYVARLEPNGDVDLTFNPGANGLVRAFAIGHADQIYVGGDFTGLGGGTGATPRQRIGRIESSGTVFGAFAPGANDSVYALAVQADGELLVGGVFTGLGGGIGLTTRISVGRLDGSSGVVDATFDPGASGAIYTFALQNSGQILVGGSFAGLGGGIGSTTRHSIGRLNPNGSVDPAFNPGANAPIYAIGIQRDGALVVGGLATAIGGGGTGTTSRSHIGRLALPHARTERFVAFPDTATGLSPNWWPDVAGPLMHAAEFSWSDDGITYLSLGSDIDPQTNFAVLHPMLPIAPNRRFRVRGVARAGFGGGSQSVYEVEAPIAVANHVENHDFSAGVSQWLTFDQPSGSGMVSNVTGGVFQFYRTGTQAVVFQQTGLPIPAFAAVAAQFHLGNTDTVRKRVSVLIHDSDFSDLAVCTFWLPPSAPFALYRMNTSPSKDWRNATISFYAATAGSGGFYQVDNVSLIAGPGAADDNECEDLRTGGPTGTAGSDLIVNGSFSSGLAPWTEFGMIDGSVTGGEYRFTKQAGTPAGVIFQSTGQAIAAAGPVAALFDLGNQAGSRMRVTVLVHDLDFSDLAACTFWLEPHQPLRLYEITTSSTDAWTNATVSLYPATALSTPAARLDNVTFRRVASAPSAGTICTTSGAAADGGAGALDGAHGLEPVRTQPRGSNPWPPWD